MTATGTRRTVPSVLSPGLLLGIGLGGFVDGIPGRCRVAARAARTRQGAISGASSTARRCGSLDLGSSGAEQETGSARPVR